MQNQRFSKPNSSSEPHNSLDGNLASNKKYQANSQHSLKDKQTFKPKKFNNYPQKSKNNTKEFNNEETKSTNNHKARSHQEPCHYFHTTECRKGSECLFSHEKERLGTCIRIRCIFCDGGERIYKHPQVEPEIQGSLTKAIEALKEQIIKVEDLKRELNAFGDGDVETREILVFKIKQLLQQRLNFIDSMVYRIKKAADSQKNSANFAKSLEGINIETRLFLKGLPAYGIYRKVADELKKTDNRFCLVLGETGSGKTTQVPQFLYLITHFSHFRIICVQPRKVAAISLAERVALELGVKLGEEVGYQTGPGKPPKDKDPSEAKYAESRWSEKTKIIFVTEGVLLKKIVSDRKTDPSKPGGFFKNVSAILLDEVHERSLLSDLIFGTLKTTFLAKYPQLKVFLASATVNLQKFQTYFNDCRYIKIEGRTFPVDIKHRPMFEDNYIEGSIEVLKEIVAERKLGNAKFQGHIIIFLTGVDEMEEVKELITETFDQEYLNENYAIHFLHGKLSNDDQQKIFEPNFKSKIILATKIAESSITIDGVRIVIDSGYDKDAFYDAQKGITILETDLISQASAIQRAGRAGRTAPGICYRLYSEETFQRMDPNKTPEIAKVNLDIAMLKILDFGFEPKKFPYLESPDIKTIVSTLKNLKLLGALAEDEKVTLEGRVMMEMTTEPRKTKAILQGYQRGCGNEVVKIIAMESEAGRLFIMPKEREERKKFMNKRIGHEGQYQGDHLDYLHIYTEWEKLKNQKKDREWCKKYSINGKALEKAANMVREIRKELFHISKKNDSIKRLMDEDLGRIKDPSQVEEDVLKCFMSSCIMGLAKFSGDRRLGYVNILDGFLFQVHNTSSQRNNFPAKKEEIDNKLVIYSQMENPRGINLAKTVSFIQRNWLCDSSIISANLRKEILYCIDKNYDYDSTEYKKPLWAIKKLRYTFKDEIALWIEAMKQLGSSIRLVPTADTLLTFVHSKAASSMVREFIGEIARDLDVAVAKENIIYNLDDANYTSIIKGGLKVVDLIFQDEYISVSYSRLNGNLSKKDVLVALDLSETNIQYITVNNQGDYTSGDIRFLDKNTARMFYEKNQHKINQKVMELQPVFSSLTRRQLFESSTIRVTFSETKSKCEAKVTFENEYDAEQAIASLTENSVIDEFAVKVNIDKKNPCAFYIKNLNPLTDEYILKNRIRGQFGDPRISVFREENTAQTKENEDEQKFVFRSLFTVSLTPEQIGNLYFTFKRPNKSQSLMHVFIALPNRQVAEKFVSEYDGKDGFFGTQKLRIKLENSTTIRVDKDVFIIMSWMINYKAQMIRKMHPDVEIMVDDPEKLRSKQRSQNFYKIKVVSKDSNQNRAIIKQFEEIVKGEEFNGSFPGDRLKLFTKDMKDCYQKVQAHYNKEKKCFYIAWNSKTKKVTLHSPFADVLKCARRDLQVALEQEMRFECIDLSNYNIKKVQNLIDERSRQEEGWESVKLDWCTRKVSIYRDKDFIENFKALISSFTRNTGNTSNNTCPICFDELNNSCCLLYHCGHKFCKECFSQHVESQADRLEVTCPIPECAKEVALKDIKEFVNDSIIKTVIQQHLLLYMRTNIAKYKNCPTPECSHVYQVGIETYKCQGCLNSYCLKDSNNPHKEHYGETCEQFRDRNDGDRQFELLIKNGEVTVSKCCNVPVMKISGCNHMTCPQCRKHFCWNCLVVFETADETYRHMGLCNTLRR